MSLFNKTLAFIAISIALFSIGGCASVNQKTVQEKADNFEKKLKSLGILYAQVNKVALIKDASNCDNGVLSKQTKSAFCGGPIQRAYVSIHTGDGRIQAFFESIPADTVVKSGSIVVLDMNRPLAQHFIRVAAIDETQSCRWDGTANEALSSSAEKFATFTATFGAIVLAPITAVGYYAYSRSNEGGVVCEGWSYKDAFKQIDWASIM